MDDMFRAIHEATQGIPIRERKYYMSVMDAISAKYGAAGSRKPYPDDIDSVTLARMYKTYIHIGRAILDDIDRSK